MTKLMKRLETGVVIVGEIEEDFAEEHFSEIVELVNQGFVHAQGIGAGQLLLTKNKINKLPWEITSKIIQHGKFERGTSLIIPATDNVNMLVYYDTIKQDTPKTMNTSMNTEKV